MWKKNSFTLKKYVQNYSEWEKAVENRLRYVRFMDEVFIFINIIVTVTLVVCNSVIRWRKQASNWDGLEAGSDVLLARDLFISRLAKSTFFAA
jgi:hypothetical protein